jgi:hypothetical protein
MHPVNLQLAFVVAVLFYVCGRLCSQVNCFIYGRGDKHDGNCGGSVGLCAARAAADMQSGMGFGAMSSESRGAV